MFQNLQLQRSALLFNVVLKYSATLPEETRKKLGQALLCCVRDEKFNGLHCSPLYLPSVVARFIDVELGYWLAEMCEAFRQEQEPNFYWDFGPATNLFRQMLLLVDEGLYRNFYGCFGTERAEQSEKRDRQRLKCYILPFDGEFE